MSTRRSGSIRVQLRAKVRNEGGCRYAEGAKAALVAARNAQHACRLVRASLRSAAHRRSESASQLESQNLGPMHAIPPSLEKIL